MFDFYCQTTQFVIFYAELPQQTDVPDFIESFMHTFKSDTPIRCSCSQQDERDWLGLQFSKCQASVKRQRKTVDMNEWRTANGHCCLLIHSHPSVVWGCWFMRWWKPGQIDLMRDGCTSSWWRGVLRSATHTPTLSSLDPRWRAAEPPGPLDPQLVHGSIHH